MQTLQLTDATRRLAPPANWDHETMGICGTLDILDRDGYMHSLWKPTEAELQRLIEGQPIVLAIQGIHHPVVSLSVAGEGQPPEDNLGQVLLNAVKGYFGGMDKIDPMKTFAGAMSVVEALIRHMASEKQRAQMVLTIEEKALAMMEQFKIRR